MSGTHAELLCRTETLPSLLLSGRTNICRMSGWKNEVPQGTHLTNEIDTQRTGPEQLARKWWSQDFSPAHLPTGTKKMEPSEIRGPDFCPVAHTQFPHWNVATWEILQWNLGRMGGGSGYERHSLRRSQRDLPGKMTFSCHFQQLIFGGMSNQCIRCLIY